MYRLLLPALVCLSAVLPLVAHTPAPGASRASAVAVQLTPCATEDSDDCYWDAAVRGNGVGQSFTVRNGVVTYPSE